MEIVIFSGTSEGRYISEYLTDKGVNHHVCVATQSGSDIMTESMYARVHIGRMDKAEMSSFLIDEGILLVIDATHPFATEVTQNIKEASEENNIRYVRVSRRDEKIEGLDVSQISHYSSVEDCLRHLERTEGNILFTTGSKMLKEGKLLPELIKRSYVRVLPNLTSINLCNQAGIDEKNIIAMYGPHTEEINMAIIKQYNIKHLVTKQSGSKGGVDEKIAAANKCGCLIHIIDRPKEEGFIDVNSCIKLLNVACGISESVNGNVSENISENISENVNENERNFGINVSLVGIGPGSDEYMTIAGRKTIDEAGVVIGAKRMVQRYGNSKEIYAEYTANTIIPILEEKLRQTLDEDINIAILFSGDTGIFSGAIKLNQELKEWGKCKSLKIIPGISSFSAFAALLGVSYGDGVALSLHGKNKDKENLSLIHDTIKHGKEVFLLTTGKEDIEILLGLFEKEYADKMLIDVGYNISYEDQKIVSTDGKQALAILKDMPEGLYVLRVRS